MSELSRLNEVSSTLTFLCFFFYPNIFSLYILLIFTSHLNTLFTTWEPAGNEQMQTKTEMNQNQNSEVEKQTPGESGHPVTGNVLLFLYEPLIIQGAPEGLMAPL